MGNLRYKGDRHGFPLRCLHDQVLVQGDVQFSLTRSCCLSADANILPTNVLGKIMAAVCQKNRDRSGAVGVMPFYPKIIGLPGVQRVCNLKWFTIAAIIYKLIAIRIKDVAIGIPCASGPEDILMGDCRYKGNPYCLSRHYIHIQRFIQGDSRSRLSTGRASKLFAFVLGVRMVSIRQQHRDRSAAAAIPSYPKIVGFPGIQCVCNLKLPAAPTITRCKLVTLSII